MQLALGALLAALFAAAWLLQQSALEAQRAELARLQAQKSQPAASEPNPQPHPATTEQIARERAELENLRAEAAKLRAKVDEARARAQTSVVAVSGLQRTTAAPGETVIRAADFREAGQATPKALIQSILWAAAHGDTNRMYQLTVFNPDADPEKFGRQMNDMRSEAERDGPEAFLTNGPSEVRILSDQVADNNDHWLTTVETHANGSSGKAERVRIRWTDAGWRLVIGTNGEPIHETFDSQP